VAHARLGRLPGHGDVRANLAAELERIRPSEILLPEGLRPAELDAAGCVVKPQPRRQFDVESATRALCRQFGTSSLAGFGCDGLGAAIGAAGALLDYAARPR